VDLTNVLCLIILVRQIERKSIIVWLHIEKLPEGIFLAASDEIEGLVEQVRTD